MNMPSRPRRYWALGLLATLILFLLCNLQLEQQTPKALQKRGDPRFGNGGNSDGHYWYEKKTPKKFRYNFPGPEEEPPKTLQDCNTKAWVFWLSFNAHEHDFMKHWNNRDVHCLTDDAWKSDACTHMDDTPFGKFNFKPSCQRRDFARLNLKPYIEKQKKMTKEQKKAEGIDFNINKKIKARFGQDLENACGPLENLGDRIVCNFMVSVYKSFCSK